jgi:2-iminobutanoate/2-iminopropanoate deaminase
MTRRKTIHIDPVRHSAPIPMAAVVGNIFMTSGIMGADPASGELAESADDQARFAFENLKRALEVAGGSLDDVVHITVFVKDLAFREAVNAPWLALFPDEGDRPARHTVKADLPGTMLVQLEVMAVIGS